MESGLAEVLEILMAIRGLIKAILSTIQAFSHQNFESTDHPLASIYIDWSAPLGM